MGFNPLESLKHGDVEFIHELTLYDYRNLITRVREISNRNDIIDGFINLKKDLKYFCFEIIYDMEEYKEDFLQLLNFKDLYIKLINSDEKIKNILYKTSWGKELVLNNLDNLIKNEDVLNVILEYAFSSFDNNLDIIKLLSLHSDLHVRFKFIQYLVINHCDKVNLLYDDITKYLTSYTDQENEQMTFLPEYMDKDDISRLAFDIFNSKLDKSVWNKIKEFVLTNYEENNLALFLLCENEKKSECIKEFANDADRFFETSYDYKLQIYKRYSSYVSEKLVHNFLKYLTYFLRDGYFDIKLDNVIHYGLWNEIKEYVDKYLSLSKDCDSRFIGAGTTTSCYKIGDYVFKLNSSKWSREDIICPNLYLILKNLEEHYIRNSNGRVVAGIEVQKYLSRKDIKITGEYIEMFENDLARMGYFCEDFLTGGHCGENCGILDSYQDADCDNPELLPDYFKKTPIVLIDRDLVYKLEKKPKAIHFHSDYFL